MRNTFCTIITLSHLPYALTLFKSITRFNENIELNILISDRDNVDNIKKIKNINFYGCANVCADGSGWKIKNKYQIGYMDEFRWSMKPVFINHLLEDKGYKKVIYVDQDGYFFNDYRFLFEDLDRFDILLTPHWRSSNPNTDRKNFHLGLIQGLYNGGFVGVNQNGRNAMHWWATACEYACEKNALKGLYVDQRYLNLLPVYFENVGIVKHRGCNVAFWNRNDCKREVQEDDTVLIDGKFSIVFIHFTNGTIKGVLDGRDPKLLPYLQVYADELKNHKSDLDIIIEFNRMIEKRSVERKNIRTIVKRNLKKNINKLRINRFK